LSDLLIRNFWSYKPAKCVLHPIKASSLTSKVLLIINELCLSLIEANIAKIMSIFSSSKNYSDISLDFSILLLLKHSKHGYIGSMDT